jgi:predicted ArsR family transcriptional regulator
MRAIDRAKNHFSKLAPREILVSQWADDQGRPLSIWVNPLTVKDRDHLIRLEKRHGTGLELVVHVIILHARTAQGEPLFTLEDKHDLMNNVDPNVLADIANQMIDDMDPAAIKKKSKPTANSASG